MYSLGSHDGDFDFVACSSNSIPSEVDPSNGYEDHTFYGSTHISTTTSHFKDLPTRIGGTDPGQRQIRVLQEGATTLHTPSASTTLDELIALDTTDGTYINTSKVESIFRLSQHGDESMANTNYSYWSFTQANGEYDTTLNCMNASDSTSGNNGLHSQHHYDTMASTTTNEISHGTTGASCDALDHKVLCLARKN